MTSTDAPIPRQASILVTASSDAGGLVAESPAPSSASCNLGWKTILTDQSHYHVKHPLQSHWTLHQKLGQVEGASSRGVSQDQWSQQLHESVTIGTVEDFWCLYNSMQDVNTIPSGCDYFFMKEGVKPMWEDPANKGGSDIRISMTKSMNAPLMWKMAVLSFPLAFIC